MAAVQAAREGAGGELKAIKAARPAELGDEHSDPLEYLGVTILGPGSWRPDAGGEAYHYFDEERNAEHPALRRLLSHILPAAEFEGGPGLVHGYWLYPGEAWPPPVVDLDNEGTMCASEGRTLADALMAYAFLNFTGEGEAAAIGQWLTDIGIPVSARTAADIPSSRIAKEPEALYEELDSQ